MRDLRREAIAYLTPPVGGFWTWSDGGTVAVLRGGGTIAFDVEIAAVLRRLAPYGLPPFSAVLLLIAATRDSWKADSLCISFITLVGMAGFSIHEEPETRLMQELDRISELDPALRSPSAAKAVLAEMVFEGMTHPRDTELAHAVVELLDSGLGDTIADDCQGGDKARASQVFQPAHLLCLSPGLARFDVEKFTLRLQTGLDQAPSEADVELPAADRVRTLLAELEEDDELAGLGGLARNLMAAVTLPRPMCEDDEMPLGGVSDITNRGPLDRLLLSELAHDDMTLAVRVAVGEALYLRRETPPRTPPRRRTMLLDVGLRSWGVPRVFATAVALALAATADRQVQLSASGARGGRLEPVDLTTRAGIVEHLSALATETHPGDALDSFLGQMPPEACEPLLITTDDVLEDPDFHARLRAAATGMLIAAVNREGDLRLYEDSPRGRKVLRQAQLDLDGLLERRPKRNKHPSPPLLDRDTPTDLPAIVSVKPFPILLPQHVDLRRAWCVEGRGAFAVTKDRRLLHFTRSDRGGRQWSDLLPSANLHWTGAVQRDGRTYAVVGSKQSGRLHLLDMLLDEAHCEISPLEIEERPVKCVCSHLGALFVVRRRGIDVLETATGRRLQSLRIPSGVTHLRGRFFVNRSRREYFALSYDAATARFEEVLGENAIRCPRLLTMFERRGVDGPIGVTVRGDLFFTATGELRKVRRGVAGRVEVAAISRDGRFVALGETGAKIHYANTLVDVDSEEAQTQYAVERSLEPEVYASIAHRSLRYRLSAAFVDGLDGMLTFLARRGQMVSLAFDINTQTIYLANKYPWQAIEPVPGTWQDFDERRGRPGAGYRLREAKWADGSRAVLDSRGLLHLISADPRTPEAALVLNDDCISVWCNDGRTCGDAYFLADGVQSNAAEVYATVLKPFVEGLR